MKIAFVTDAIWPFNRGGKEKRLFDISSHLLKRGHEVHIYTMKWWNGKNEHVENGIVLHGISPLMPLYSGRRRSIREGLVFGISCLGLLFEDWDVIDVDHMPFFPLFFVKLVCLLKQKKMIATWHEVWGRKYWKKYLGKLGEIAYLIEKTSVLLPDRIISVSQLTTNKLKSDLQTTTEIFTIEDGIDFKHIKKIRPSEIISDVIFIGRLLEHKNVHLLIESLVNLKMKHPNIKCLIIGDGPERSNLERLAKELDLIQNILFLGFVEKHDEVIALLKSSKVFALPSVREGFGIAVLEALACNIPVVTTNHSDNAAKGLIEEGINGFLSCPTADGLAQQIARVLKPKKTLQMLERIENYDWEIIIEQIEQVFLEKTKGIIVTTSWDDGHILDLKMANLLMRHGIKGTFYVCPKDREFNPSELLSIQQTKFLSKNFEIGAHTMTHPKLSQISKIQAADEISESKKFLEQIIRKPVISFCYPGGFYNFVNVEQVKNAGFFVARTTKRFSFDFEKNLYELSTSIHAYRHFLDLWKIVKFSKFNPIKFLAYFLNWDILAIEMFERMLHTGGIFHLWGHSWEIEKNDDWDRLEKLLIHIKNKAQVQYRTNGELYE